MNSSLACQLSSNFDHNLYVYILCKINLAIILYGSVNPHRDLIFYFLV